MTSGTALVLTASLVAAPCHAAAQALTAGPISRAVRHEALRLASPPTDASPSFQNPYAEAATEWLRVRSLEPGTALLVTVNNERRKRRFDRADGEQLIVRDAHSRAENIRRADIARVDLTSFRGSRRAAVGAAALGALVGGMLGFSLKLESRCRPNCGGVEAGIWSLWVGLPVGGGSGRLLRLWQDHELRDLSRTQRHSRSARERGRPPRPGLSRLRPRRGHARKRFALPVGLPTALQSRPTSPNSEADEVPGIAVERQRSRRRRRRRPTREDTLFIVGSVAEPASDSARGERQWTQSA